MYNNNSYEDEDDLECPVCYKKCQGDMKSQRKAMKYHIEKHNEKEDDVYCPICYRGFVGNWRSQENSLQQHLQTHQPRNKTCPICKETRFKSQGNVAVHVESGSCNGCRGKEKGRKAVYDFVSSKEECRGLMAKPAGMLEYKGGRGSRDQSEVPDEPYRCSTCDRRFALMGALMQHKTYSSRCASNRQRALW